MKDMILKANRKKFTVWEGLALAAVVILLFFWCAGCKSTSTVTNNADGTFTTNITSTFDPQKAVNVIAISVPGTVRLSVARYPKAEPYLRDAVTAIRLFTSGNKYDPASLRAAIATTHIRELQSDDIQAAIDTIAALYKAYYGDVVAQQLNQVDNLVPILNAIADSIEIGLAKPSAQFGAPLTFETVNTPYVPREAVYLVDQHPIQAETTIAAIMKQRTGTNYIGVYLGMIAVRGVDHVMMFSATSGECLKLISYQDFDEIFVRKIRPEYASTVYPQ